MDFKYLKSGYQGKPDQMRELAEKLTDPRRGHEAEFTFSKSAADKERMRPYKTGGMVCKDDDKKIRMSSNYHIEKMKKDISKEEEKERKAEREKREEKEREKERERERIKADPGYRKGGHVKHCDKNSKYAMGGIAKERLDEGYKKGGQIKDCDKKQKYADGGMIWKQNMGQATKDGNVILKKKKSYTNNF